MWVNMSGVVIIMIVVFVVVSYWFKEKVGFVMGCVIVSVVLGGMFFLFVF